MPTLRVNERTKGKKVKVLFFVPFLSGNGGTETVVRNTRFAADQLGLTDQTWKLVSFGGTSHAEWLDAWHAQIYNFTDSRLIQMICYVLVMPILISSQLFKEQPDIIVSTNPVIWAMARVFSRVLRLDCKIVGWYHYSLTKKPIRKRLIMGLDAFLCISTGIQKELLQIGYPKERTFVVYNPVQTRVEQVPRSAEGTQLIYAGRVDFDGQKNVSELFRGLNRLSSNVDWHLDVYGAVDQETKQRLLRILPNRENRNRIVFHGFSVDFWSSIKFADVVVMTSKYEGFPMVLCEAAARGISLISSDCPTGPADIVNSQNGYLYKMGDVTTLAQTLTDVLTCHSKLPTPAMVSKSVQKYSFSAFASNLQSVFQTLVQSES